MLLCSRNGVEDDCSLMTEPGGDRSWRRRKKKAKKAGPDNCAMIGRWKFSVTAANAAVDDVTT